MPTNRTNLECGHAGAAQRQKAPASSVVAAAPGRPRPWPSCRRELGPAPREFTSTATHQPSYVLSGISPKSRAAFCRCELSSPPGSSHLQNAREAGSRELGLCACVIARSGDVSNTCASRPGVAAPARPARPEGARGAAEVCGAPCASGRRGRSRALGRTRTPTHRDDGPQRGYPLIGQCIPASP